MLVLEEHADHLLLDNVAVEPARQGTGDGRVLLDFAEAEARRRGLPEIRLYTNELMERNIALYAARGYAETERRQEKGFSRVFMAKRVAAEPTGGPGGGRVRRRAASTVADCRHACVQLARPAAPGRRGRRATAGCAYAHGVDERVRRSRQPRTSP